MKILFTNIKQVYEYYASKSREILSGMKDAVVLKTDTFNETLQLEDPARFVVPIIGTLPNVKHLTTVELVERRASAAAAMFPDATVICDDLRHVEFPDAGFDCILDLSTIDHIPPKDAYGLVGNYFRWLKVGGTLLIVAWCDWGKTSEVVEKHESTNQYYFNATAFPERLRLTGFEIIESEVIFGGQAGPMLTSFVCRKGTKE